MTGNHPSESVHAKLIEMHWLPFDEALAQVPDDTIREAKTMLGLMLAENVLSNQAGS